MSLHLGPVAYNRMMHMLCDSKYGIVLMLCMGDVRLLSSALQLRKLSCAKEKSALLVPLQCETTLNFCGKIRCLSALHSISSSDDEQEHSAISR